MALDLPALKRDERRQVIKVLAHLHDPNHQPKGHSAMAIHAVSTLASAKSSSTLPLMRLGETVYRSYGIDLEAILPVTTRSFFYPPRTPPNFPGTKVVSNGLYWEAGHLLRPDKVRALKGS